MSERSVESLHLFNPPSFGDVIVLGGQRCVLDQNMRCEWLLRVDGNPHPDVIPTRSMADLIAQIIAVNRSAA